MAPPNYSVALQKGIVGGFAPPTPNAFFTLNREKDAQHLTVQRQKREPGQASLQSIAPKSIPAAEADALVHELHSILKEIPTEQPPGSEDIYGMDIGICWESDDLQWMNGGPQGCGQGQSSVKPTPEQKQKFKRAVEIVERLAE